MTWNTQYNKVHAFKIFSDSSAFNALDNSITISSPSDTSDNINEFTNTEFLNSEITADITGGDDIILSEGDKIINFNIDQSGSMLWNDRNNLRYTIADRIANRIDSTYNGDISFNVFTFKGKKAKITSMATNSSDNPFNDLIDLRDCYVDLDNYKDAINRLSGVRIVRNATRYPKSPLDGDIVFEGIATKITDSEIELGTTYYYKIFTFDEDLKFSNGKRFFVNSNNDIVPRGLDSMSLSFLNGVGANVDQNTLASWQFNNFDNDYVFDFTGKNDLAVDSGMQWISSAETMLGDSGIRLSGSSFSFTDTNDDLLIPVDGKLTLMAWVFPYNTGSDQVVFSRGGFDYIISINSLGAIEIATPFDSVGTSSGFVTFDAWNFIVVTIDFSLTTDAVKYYVNGTLVDTSTLSGGVGSTSGGTVYIGNDFSGTSQFTGAISYLSVHSDVKDETYILNRYLDGDASDQDNGDRLLLGRGYVDSDYVGNDIKVVFSSNEDPSLPDQFNTVYEQISASEGDFYFTHKTNFNFNENYNYRIFVNDVNNYSHIDNSRLYTLSPDFLSQEAQERKLLDSVVISPPTSTLVIDGDRKAYIKWDGTNLDASIKQVRIYHSIEEFPIIDANSAIPINESYTGELIYAGDPTRGSFLHQNIINDVFHFYTIVFSDGISYLSTAENLVASPESGIDESSIPLLDVNSIAVEQVANSNSVNIQWELPYNQKSLNGYFGEEFIFFAKVTDEFNNLIDVDDFNVTASITSSFTKIDDDGEDVFNGIFTLNNPLESSLYQFIPSKFKDGVFRGTLVFPSIVDLLNYKQAELNIVLNISIPDISSEKDVNGNYSENIFTYKSRPFTVVARNPISFDLTNLDGRKVKVNKNNVISSISDQTLQEKVEFDGFYVGASEEFKIRAIMSKRNSPLVFPSTFNVEIYETRGDIFSGNNLTPRTVEFSENLLQNVPSIEIAEIDVLDENGNPTGEKIESTYYDIAISTPSHPVNLLVFVEMLISGFRHVSKFLVVCENPLQIDLISNIPSSDGVSTSEQSALVYKLDPDDPENLESRTLVPDGTPVIWTLINGSNATIDRPFISTSPIEPSFQVPENSVVSFTTNGLAKDIIFGPIAEVEVRGYDNNLDPIFENYTISANVFYDGLSADSEQGLELIPLIFETNNLAGSYFLMEFDNVQQKFYTDGISYAKLTMSHDPLSAVTRYSSCFVERLNELGKNIRTLSPGIGVQIATDDPNMEIVYGDVSEVIDPYTGRARLNTDSSNIKYGSAIVPLDNGDETYVYFRKNETNTDQKINSLVNIDNPCDCLGLSREPSYNSEVRVSGSLTSIFDGSIETLQGGGSLSKGIPPTVLIPQEPLSIKLAGIRVEDEFIEGLQIDGDTINELVFDISFAGNPVPNGVEIDTQVINLTEDILAVVSTNVVSSQAIEPELSPVEKSYASVNLRGIPRGKPFEAYLLVTATYDELGSVDRKTTSCFLVSYNSDEETSAIVSNLFSDKLYSMNTAPLDASWNTLSDMPISRSSHGLHSDGLGYLYAIGGINSSEILSDSHKYEVGTDTWSEIENMPTARFGFQSVFVSGNIYVFGGYEYDTTLNKVEVSQAAEVYNTVTGQWSILTAMPSMDMGFVDEVKYGLANGVVEHVSGNIYFLSGVRAISEDGSFVTYNDRILTYNIVGDSWSWTDPIEEFEVFLYNRIDPVSFVDGSIIYILFGTNQADDGSLSFASTMFSFDTGTGTLSDANGDLGTSLDLNYKAATTYFSNKSYVVGGSTPTSRATRASRSLDFGSSPFSDAADGIPDLPESLSDSGMTNYSSVLYLSGGNRSGNDKDMVLIDAKIDSPSMILNSRDNVVVTVELKNDDGELVTDTVDVIARGYIQSKDREGLDEYLVPDSYVKYPVLFVQDTKTVSSGKTSFVLSARSDDVLKELFSTIDLNEGSIAERYKIVIEILVDSSTRFGKTILNTTNESIDDNLLRSDCVSIFNNVQIGQLNVDNTVSENSFSIIPFFERQGESAVVDVYTDDVWVNCIKKENSALLSYPDLSALLTDLSFEIPFGNSPLYNSLSFISNELSLESYDNIDKLIYTLTDKEESFSSISLEDSIINVNSIDGPKEVPCIIGNISDVDYPSMYSLEKYTESNHLNEIASETNGQGVTIRNENVDDIVKILAGTARGSLGHGNAIYVHDFDEEVVIKSITVNYDINTNTGGYWYVEKSNNGQSFSGKSKRVDPNETLQLEDYNARYLRFDMVLHSGLSTGNTTGTETTPTASPKITSIDITYTSPKEDFIYINSQTIELDPSQVVVAVDSNNEFGENIDVSLGVSTSDSINWDDFDTDPEPAVESGGKVIILRRQGSVQGTILEPLIPVDGYMFKAEYGAWHSGASVSVFNLSTGASISSSKYSLNPDKGLIIFNEKQTSSLYIEINNASRIKLAAKIINKNSGKDYKLYSLGYLYTTRDDCLLLRPQDLIQFEATDEKCLQFTGEVGQKAIIYIFGNQFKFTRIPSGFIWDDGGSDETTFDSTSQSAEFSTDSAGLTVNYTVSYDQSDPLRFTIATLGIL